MRIAVCSCADYRTASSHDVWSRIRAEGPDLLLLLGDNIYLPWGVNPRDTSKLRQELTRQYQALLGDEHFQRLIAFMETGGRRVAAIYDDHDSIGEDMAYPVMTPAMCSAAQGVFFQHLAFAASPPNLYRSFDTDLARVIMLDTRSYRIQFAKTLDEVLGAEQAAWFRAEVAAASGKPYLLLCSGITLHLYKFYVSAGWYLHAEAYKEMTRLLADRAGVLFLSGDIHSNHLKMKSGVIELVSSGVARKPDSGVAKVQNYAIVDLDADAATVTSRSLDAKDAWSRSIRLADWRI